MSNRIKVKARIECPVAEVWDLWTDPAHILKWNAASDDWHTTFAEAHLEKGGGFSSRMEAKDGSFGFDFSGTYTDVETHSHLCYALGADRSVKVSFLSDQKATILEEEFTPETQNPVERQRQGWQSILDNFKRYAESQTRKNILKFSSQIKAPAEKVFDIMFNEKTYPEWTKVFNPTSRYIGLWQKGETIRFVGTDKNGNQGGIVSKIRENMPNKFVSIEHLGLIQGSQEIMSGPAVDGWVGALENYWFTQEGATTKLMVAMESHPDFESYFRDTWPKAMIRLKEICETSQHPKPSYL